MTINKLPVVLYLDYEMGDSAIKERYVKMCPTEKGIEPPPNLLVKHILKGNLLDESFQKTLEAWIVEFGINILMLDPLGNAWDGDENKKLDVDKLTSYLNTLIHKYKISIVVAHHFRKATKGFTSGGEMAAGSYKWSAWLDNHITLQGNLKGGITVSCEKNRHRIKFERFLAKINPDTLAFEFVTDFERKYTEATLIELFEHFNSDRVAIPELIKYAESIGKGSHSTIRKLIRESDALAVDDSGLPHHLYKKVADRSLFGDADIQDAEISTDSALE